MSIRGEVEYAIFKDIENPLFLEAMRIGEDEASVPADITTSEIVGLLVQWMGGITDALLLLADHVDELASD